MVLNASSLFEKQETGMLGGSSQPTHQGSKEQSEIDETCSRAVDRSPAALSSLSFYAQDVRRTDASIVESTGTAEEKEHELRRLRKALATKRSNETAEEKEDRLRRRGEAYGTIRKQ